MNYYTDISTERLDFALLSSPLKSYDNMSVISLQSDISI